MVNSYVKMMGKKDKFWEKDITQSYLEVNANINILGRREIYTSY